MNLFFKSLILTIIVVVLALVLAKEFDNQRIKELGKEIELVIQDYRAQQMIDKYSNLMAKDSKEYCDQLISLRESQANRNIKISSRIQEYEKKNLFTEEYDMLKRSYYINLLDMYVSEFQLKKKCNLSDASLLVFYSIDKSCSACLAQNEIVLKLMRKCQNLRVYSLPIDGNENLPFILKNRYNITDAPSIVINDDKVLNGLYSERQLITELQRYNVSCKS
ncbi:MAG: hypothetical protein N3E37_00670 [Candidatus Micrarchaeota archaeon]|nr:hypothetical protein [Candidatus Micrarchaeota archaeon]